MLFAKVTYIICFVFLAPKIVFATSPCPPDNSQLCRKLGGTWTASEADCGAFGSCSIPLLLVDFECKDDKDCRACGSSECRPDISQFTELEKLALGKSPQIDWEYFSKECPPHLHTKFAVAEIQSVNC